MKYHIDSLDQLSIFVEAFLPQLKKNKIFLLYGEMGVGKTTFVQELLKKIGIIDLEGSPTYSLINSYWSEKYGKIYHIDLYRLKTIEEAYDIGLDEILNENSFCFIEWPDKIKSMLPTSYTSISFFLNSDLMRTIEINE